MKAVKNSEVAAREELRRLLGDKRWRIDNLYRVVNEHGDEVQFLMRPTQKLLYLNMHYMNVIPKSRQHGISTFCQVYGLDLALFVPNLSAIVIAQTRDDAENIFFRNIYSPYQKLDQNLKNEIKLVKETGKHLRFSNGSSIRVLSSGRSGTFQYCHISELGKICAKRPDVAKEIKTGTLNTVHPGSIVMIESTAEGREGLFYDICETARRAKDSGRPLSKLDYKLHFFGWNQDRKNRIDSEGIVIQNYQKEYFEQLEIKHGIKLDAEQKAWYVKKQETQGDDMKQEHPTTYEEAFQASIEGTYYKRQFQVIRKEKRICSVPYQEAIPVDTWWDLGMDDTMVIWFTQDVGREIHVIDFYENSGEWLKHYADVLDEKGYRYGQHWAPHDIDVKELGTPGSRIDSAKKLGIKFRVSPRLGIGSGIDMVRAILPICWFDEEKTALGVKALEAYRKEWNPRLACYRKTPLHDWASNAADAFRTLGVNHRTMLGIKNMHQSSKKKPNKRGWT